MSYEVPQSFADTETGQVGYTNASTMYRSLV